MSELSSFAKRSTHTQRKPREKQRVADLPLYDLQICGLSLSAQADTRRLSGEVSKRGQSFFLTWPR